MPSFPPLVGFGFCPGPERGTPTRLAYRYVPAGFADTAASRVAGALNAAAARGMLDPLGPVEPTESNPAVNLTNEGWALWRRLPLYGTLDVHGQERFEWTAFWDGLPCVTYSGALVPELLARALRSTPQHLWAQRHFGRHTRCIHGVGDPDAAVMEMREGTEPLEAAAEERVTAPEGLWKVVWAPISAALAVALPEEETPQMRRVAGSRVSVQGGTVELEAAGLLRWELPAPVVPGALEMLEAHDVPLLDARAPVSVVPCFDSETPLLSLGEGPGGAHAALLSPEPPEHWTPERRQELLAFVKGSL